MQRQHWRYPGKKSIGVIKNNATDLPLNVPESVDEFVDAFERLRDLIPDALDGEFPPEGNSCAHFTSHCVRCINSIVKRDHDCIERDLAA